ncbi:hypothetical protein SAPIO_CDS6605 [Scedosporium apiospermum]|uniref:FAD-binding PCMH-type domain-containing protein n=1 Tax=Pseudallescheria apiosperma TaxID=563466 RepID=A0A084G3J7_PSEDA|nr:uncharacterized protein SAPIO_CDS6605 [Scedosporium apiospermum]KEZ41909.1 hypothetical protein SAPIO_CDS6605 [Scedosporium apiospermum]
MLPLKILLAIPVLSGVLAAPECKCAPGDDCWPSPRAWKALNSTLNGRLIHARPPASVCYPSEPNYDPAACEYVLAKWHLSTFHSEDPISISYPQWADNPCPPIFPNGTSIGGDPDAGTKGCKLGKYPTYVVNATGAEDIATAVKWAAKRNIRLNIKNTGHNHLGRSTAYGSLSIWTHYIRGIEFHDNFKPKSCPSNDTNPQMAATVAAGEVDKNVYAAAHEHGAVVVGGANPGVGLVGWFTGGGHGFLSATYGMGVDNVLEATIVTVDGKVITANACNNPELFYAIRGGGGGTYGIVTSVTMKAHPEPRTTNWNLMVTLQDSSKEKEWWDLMAFFHSDLRRLKEGGAQGYYYVFPPQAPRGYMLMTAFMLFDKPNGTSTEETAPSFFEAYHGDPENEPVAQNFAMGSHLLPAEALEDVETVSKTLQELSRSDIAGPNLMIGHMVANSANRHLDTALNPAWRDTISHFVVGTGWPDTLPADAAQQIRNYVTFNATAALRKLAPDSGAYFNEMDPYEPDWQYSAFGANYPRLKAIKDRYDPEGVLYCRHCVGSEAWVENSAGKLCRPDWWERD